MNTNEYVNIPHTRLHGGWLLHKPGQENKWREVWAVLRDNVLFFFTSQNTCLETHIGTLHLASDSSVHIKDGDARNGFKFDLHTAPKRKNKFKAKTLYEREAWRVYIEGVITGAVPESLILNPKEHREIQEKLYLAKQQPRPQHELPSPTPIPAAPFAYQAPTGTPPPGHFPDNMRRASVPSINSGSIAGEFDPPADSVSQFSHSSSSSGGSRNLDCGGGPFMHHKFYRPDYAGDSSKTPSWFFENCSRELACRILSECSAAGNTLVRESLSARPNGSYAISKRLERTGEITHYEVIRVAEGYKINVENPHQPMKTLSEVMDFFIQMSGSLTTFPMKSNNLKELGVEYAAYTRRIYQMSINEDSGESVDLSYEVPVTKAPPPPLAAPPLPTMCPPAPPFPPGSAIASPSSSRPVSNKTWSSKKQHSLPEGMRGNQTVGVGGHRQSDQRGSSTIAELQQRLNEQSVVLQLDSMLDSVENTPRVRNPSDAPPPLPQVPANRPKLDVSGQPIYINQPDAAKAQNRSEPEPEKIHPRWNKRAVSLPHLDIEVPHSVSAPNMVFAGRATKAPPPVAVKPKSHHMSVSSVSSDDADGTAGSGGIQPVLESQHSSRRTSENSMVGMQSPGASRNSLVEELQKKLQLGPSALRPVNRQSSDSQLQPKGPVNEKDSEDDADDYYEDINEYQNMPQARN